MTKKLFLAATFSLLSLLQMSQPSRAADKPPSQAQKSQTSEPKKEHKNNLSVYMHGAYVVAIIYKDCDGNHHREPIGAGSTINRCVAPNTSFFAVEASDATDLALPLYTNHGGSISKSILMKEDGATKDGVTMDCGGSPLIWNMKCDWSTPYEPQ